MNQRYPSLDDFANALVVKMGAIEIIRQPIYDYIVYPTAGLANLTFFQFPIGQGAGANGSASPGNAGNAKTIADTNMQAQGAFPAPQAFWAQSIECDFQPGSSAAANTFAVQNPSNVAAAAAAAVQAGANDASTFYNSGSLTLAIGQKPYYQEGPLFRFPTRPILRLDVSVASNSATAVEVVKEKFSVDGELVTLDPGLGIMTSMNFGVTLAWPAVVATPSGFNGRVGIVLDGYLFRAVQ